MRILTVPNWSFGRDNDLLRRFHQVLDAQGTTIHYLQSDIDHNRTVSAFSGDTDQVFSALEMLCGLAFDRIDLNHHVGVHPRIGALDVCPFLLLDDPATRESLPPAKELQAESGDPAMPSLEYQPSPELLSDRRQLLSDVETFSAKISGRFDVPVFLYEKSERGRHEADLPSLRKGGFGGLSGKELNPDFGPSHAHPKLGITVIGVRDWLIAINVNLNNPDPSAAKAIATEIRNLRAAGDHRFLGVRALGFPLGSAGLSQVSINMTLPDITTVDAVAEWVAAEALSRGVKVMGIELIGVIRRRDLATSSRLIVKPSQIVDQ